MVPAVHLLKAFVVKDTWKSLGYTSVAENDVDLRRRLVLLRIIHMHLFFIKLIVPSVDKMEKLGPRAISTSLWIYHLESAGLVCSCVCLIPSGRVSY